MAITTAVMELAGGSGYMRSHPLERYLLDAMRGQLMAWPPAVSRDFLGKALLGIPPPPPQA
ncbi:acyl-CoA dehydrogenase family protein [Corallococcus sp. M7]